jgi:hypothetical protein
MSTNNPTALQLTQRDVDLIITAFTYHGVTIDQIAARFWDSNQPSVPCYRRIGTRLKVEYLTAKRLASATGEGKGKNPLRAGPASFPLLAEHFNLPIPAIRRIAQFFPAYATHHLQICSIRLTLDLATQALPGVDLLEWVNEAPLRKHPLRITLPGTLQTKSLPRSLTLVPVGKCYLVLPLANRKGERRCAFHKPWQAYTSCRTYRRRNSEFSGAACPA